MTQCDGARVSCGSRANIAISVEKKKYGKQIPFDKSYISYIFNNSFLLEEYSALQIQRARSSVDSALKSKEEKKKKLELCQGRVFEDIGVKNSFNFSERALPLHQYHH